MISVKFDDSLLQRRLESLGRALPGIVAKALNDSTREARDELIKQLPVVFDRPTPYTMKRSIFAKFTNAQKLSAEVFIADKATKAVPPVRYLAPSVYGGARSPKSLEVRLRKQAGVLGSDEWLVPSKSLQLDSFGNAPTGLSKKILSQLRANADDKTNENSKLKTRRNQQKKKRGGRYFIGRPGGGRKRYGIYERLDTAFGSAVRPVFMVTRKPTYKPRFHVYETVKKGWDARVRTNLTRRMAEATKK